MRLLQLEIQEPLPGHVLPEMAATHGREEAARRYRAVVVTTLRQLRGLDEMRLRLAISPADACEAIRFWLLPRLAETWLAENGVFRSAGWEIDFGGNHDAFEIHAAGAILCPFLGARWVHTALLGLGRTVGEVIGPSSHGGHYFHARAAVGPGNLPPLVLPGLDVIRTSEHWDQAIDSALGPALKRAWEEEGS